MMKRFFVLILAVIISVAIVGCGSPKSKYTLSQYNRLTAGMSHGECMRIMGDQGTPTGESVTPGIPGVMPTMKMETYSWQNEDGSNMQLMFQNDKLITKGQFGLK